MTYSLVDSIGFLPVAGFVTSRADHPPPEGLVPATTWWEITDSMGTADFGLGLMDRIEGIHETPPIGKIRWAKPGGRQ